ncbi:UNKNOWN [Stylonychia lemnae]|uniref:Uncharacterized protein n=1 Tax=Stylonychia lemnae TaxID=5949 RepID=A0A077ZV49_STYLE|nr:UNKNOWN [Stylonychia lemnae]|eukprot:CDW73770.1 UNKNOWN [Stylonychia lemnae]
MDQDLVNNQSKFLRDSLKDVLLQTVSLNDDLFQRKLKQVMGKPRFSQSLRFYRDRTENPETLARKIYTLVLDPNSEYKRIKYIQNLIKNKMAMRLKEQLITFKKSYQRVKPSELESEIKNKMKMQKSKSSEYLGKVQTNKQQTQKRLEKLTNYNQTDIFEDQCPDPAIFINKDFKQDQFTKYKRNNYAFDLIKPNMNLSQFQNQPQNSMMRQQKQRQPDLSYLFNLANLKRDTSNDNNAKRDSRKSIFQGEIQWSDSDPQETAVEDNKTFITAQQFEEEVLNQQDDQDEGVKKKGEFYKLIRKLRERNQQLKEMKTIQIQQNDSQSQTNTQPIDASEINQSSNLSQFTQRQEEPRINIQIIQRNTTENSKSKQSEGRQTEAKKRNKA